MHVHYMGVTEHVEKFVEVTEMGGSLENPAGANLTSSLFLPLEQLQHPSQILICRSEIGVVEPLSIARYIGRRFGHMRKKRVCQKHDLFFSLVRIHGVDGEQFRGKGPSLLLSGFGVTDTGVIVVWLPADSWRRFTDLPAVGRVVALIGSEKTLHQGCASPHHAHHDDWWSNALFGDLWVSGEPVVGTEPGTQAVYHSPAKNHATQFVQWCRTVSVEEHTERFPKG